jgi:Ca2+-binding EF-hand superfamily protein
LFKEITKQETLRCHIDRINLKKFLMMASFLPNDNLVLAILRRCDVDGDAMLNFMEFAEVIRPSF